MSSSSPKARKDPTAAPFTYPVVTPAAGSAGAAAAAPREREREEPRGGRPESEIFEQGRQAGQAQLRAEFDDALAKCRGEIARALQEFVRERQSYYRRVEGEVVQLALAIARKILHREVQIDPQALAGIVRVTLEKLETGTQVTLHVPPAESAEWRRYFACQTEDTPAPEIREEAALAAGECRLETAMGSTEVGLQAQLKEIETGLLDLLAERPGVPAPNPTPKPIPNPIR